MLSQVRGIEYGFPSSLKRGNMQRHLNAFLHAALDHRAHDENRRANDFRFVGRDGEPEVLNQVDHDSLHLNQSVESVSLLTHAVETDGLTKNASQCTREHQRLWKVGQS